MPVFLVAAALAVGEVNFQETEGLCCWVAPFSTLGADSGTGG